MENFTVPVPNGTTNHGNPNLICTPVQWTDSFIFFFANYFAHAFTVKQLPGERLAAYVFTILIAMLYPYSGLPRGIESIIRRAIFFRSTELHTACRAGALCVVVRSAAWWPAEDQKPICNIGFTEARFPIAEASSGDLEHVPLSQADDVELGVVDTPSKSV